MLAKTAQQLITGARQLSDTINNTFVTDTEVLDRCNEALAELYEWIVGTYERYQVSELLFSLTGGAVAAVGADRANLPSDFMKELTVIKDPNTATRTRVRRLASLAEMARRDVRCFDLLGGQLVILPGERASGNYQLLYTPQAPELSILSTPPPHVVSLNTGSVNTAGLWSFPAASFNDSDLGSTFTVANASNSGNNGAKLVTAIGNSTTVYTAPTGLVNETFGASVTASIQPVTTSTRTFDGAGADIYNGSQRNWVIAAGAFTPSDVGGMLTVNLSAPHDVFNGAFIISTVLSATSIIVASTLTGSLFLTAAAPGAFTVNRDTPGTIPSLPQNMATWAEYIITGAAIRILDKKKQETDVLERRLTSLKARVEQLAADRASDPQQVPLTQNSISDWDGWP